MGRKPAGAVLILCLCAAGCSQSPAPRADTGSAAARPKPLPPPQSRNPVAKYLELTGFRISEKGPGKLGIQFAVVNHSDADIGDVTLDVQLRTTQSKPEDAPLAAFTAKVPGVSPEALKEVTVTVPTALRVYELPDWQYLHADFDVTEPK